MAYKKSFGLPLAVTLLASFGASLSGWALSASTPPAANIPISRLAGDWRTSAPVLVPGSKPVRHPAAPLTAAPADARLDRVLLLLSSSTAQQTALTAAVEGLHDPSSPLYHQWFSPASYAAAFANSAADVATLAEWLQSEGLDVAPIPASRGWIEFSGTVAQIEQAFHTRIAVSSTPAGTRIVLAADISAPSALAPLIQGLASLDGAIAEPALTTPEPLALKPSELAAHASLHDTPALTPQLATQFLHLDSLHTAGIQGAGQSIAIAARSNLNPADLAAFRSAFGLAASTLQVAPAGPDPGRTADQAAATLAASWAAVAAPDAQLILVPAATTAATDGLDLSIAAIVDRQLASTVAVGYSSCEASLSPAHQALYAALYRQAAAQGISMVAAAGDSGPSACRLAGDAAPVSVSYGVNALASTPWNTAVGVAAFDAAGRAQQPAALAAWSPLTSADPAYAGGGGTSALYASPAWQPIPAEAQLQVPPQTTHNRLLPDLALPTAIDTAASPGLAFCFSSIQASAGCTLVRSGGSAAATALFAGIAALVNQKNGPQGNLAPHLYALSRQSGIFTDVDYGTAQLACAAGTPGCASDGLIGFTAVPGFDLATGLGVVDAQKLVTRWAISQATGTAATSVTMSVSPTEENNTYNPSASITLTANVISENGGATPTGTVTFVDGTEAQPISSAVALNSSGVATVTVEGVFGQGGNQVFASYSGDSNYAPASSTPPVNINIQPSTTSLAVVPSATSVTPGQTISVTVTLTVGSPPEGNVAPAGVVTLNVDGLASGNSGLTSSLGVTTATFSVTIPASSSVLTHSLQAVYAGNTNYSASTSPAVTVTVAKASTTTTVTPATTTPAAGSSLVVNATVTATGTGSSSGPTGTVTFLLDMVSQGVVPLTSASSSTGVSYTIPSVPAGTHALAATYSGDTNYATSTSASVTLTAAKSATTTTLTATPAVLAAGATETLTATVAPTTTVTGTTYTLTGTVSFYDNATTLLGTATLSAGTASVAGVALADNIAHSITAIYSGDTSWLTSTSAALLFAATTVPDTVVLTSNYSASNPGQALILTATVTPNAIPATTGEQNPTGNIIFYDGTTVIGTSALSASIGDSSIATFTTQSLPGGQDVLSAYYVGDFSFDPETSNLLTLDILNFTVSPSPSDPSTNLNIVQGASGSASFLISGQGGFSSAVQVVCAVPTQDNMTCTASPQDVNPPTTVTFVIQTFLPGQQTTTTAARSNHLPRLWTRVVSGTALAVLGVFLLPFGKRRRIFAERSSRSLWILLLLLVGLGASGVGCSSVAGVNGTGTPLGVATIKITASANVDNTVVSHSVFLSVNVIPPTSSQ